MAGGDGIVKREEAVVRRSFQGRRVLVGKPLDQIKLGLGGRNMQWKSPVPRSRLNGVRKFVGKELKRVRGGGLSGKVQRERPVVGPFPQGRRPFGGEKTDHWHGQAVDQSDVQRKMSHVLIPYSERLWALECKEHDHLERRVEAAGIMEGRLALQVPRFERGEPRVR